MTAMAGPTLIFRRNRPDVLAKQAAKKAADAAYVKQFTDAAEAEAEEKAKAKQARTAPQPSLKAESDAESTPAAEVSDQPKPHTAAPQQNQQHNKHGNHRR